MWESETERLRDGAVLRLRLGRPNKPLTCADVLRLWQDDEGFRTFFNGLLADPPFSAYRWETPPVTVATVDRPFEFVLVDTPGLDRPADPTAFAAQFGRVRGGELVAAFQNLSGDAFLVVPRPTGPTAAYGHLAAFARHGPAAQIHAFWQAVGRELAQRLTERPVWLSTAGMGVPWLHVRLDSRPKYYAFREYAAL